MDILCIGSNEIVNHYYSLLLKNKFNYNVKSVQPEKLTSPEVKHAKAIILTKFLNQSQFNHTCKILDKNKFNKEIYSSNDFSTIDHNRFSFLKNPNITINKDMNKKESPWIQIPFNILKIFKTIPCEICVKNGLLYDSLFLRGSNPAIVKNPPKEVYFQRKYLNIFCKQFSEQVARKRKELKKISNQGVLISLSFEKAQLLGLSKKDLLSIENQIDEIVYEISNSKKELLEVLSKILNTQTYITSHSMTLAYILSKALKSFPQEIQKMFIKAAIFHDFKLSSLEDTNEFMEKRTPNFINHSQSIINLLKKLDFCTEEFKELILNHHEKPDGSGLLKKDSFSISYYSAIFNIAHKISIDLLHKDFDETKKELHEIYSKGVYNKALNHFDFITT